MTTTTTTAPKKRVRTARPTKTATVALLADPAPEQPANDGADRPGTIVFQKRRMAVKRPSPEQLGMWQITADELSRLDTSGLSAQRAAKLLARAIRLISSVLSDEDDREWLQDQIMDGELDLAGAADVLVLAGQNWAAAAAAPTTGPAPKAVRRR